ncbi:MAG: (d)CMP kinase, partial [Mariprofundaceae bacterium]|nr:(d)CMP kinase [Mariprofundaceae bacterium]
MSDWKPIPGLQIAIDGPSGSGKGTIARLLAEAMDLAVLDTGLLYRFIGYSSMQQGAEDETAVLACMDQSL